jgi:hypothetical protein
MMVPKLVAGFLWQLLKEGIESIDPSFLVGNRTRHTVVHCSTLSHSDDSRFKIPVPRSKRMLKQRNESRNTFITVY